MTSSGQNFLDSQIAHIAVRTVFESPRFVSLYLHEIPAYMRNSDSLLLAIDMRFSKLRNTEIPLHPVSRFQKVLASQLARPPFNDRGTAAVTDRLWDISDIVALLDRKKAVA